MFENSYFILWKFEALVHVIHHKFSGLHITLVDISQLNKTFVPVDPLELITFH